METNSIRLVVLELFFRESENTAAALMFAARLSDCSSPDFSESDDAPFLSSALLSLFSSFDPSFFLRLKIPMPKFRVNLNFYTFIIDK